MFDRFDARSRSVLGAARRIAQELRQDAIGAEHVLLALIEEGGPAAQACEAAGMGYDDVAAAVCELCPPLRHTTFGQLPFMPRVRSGLERALEAAQALGHHGILPEHLLLGMLRARSGGWPLGRRNNVLPRVVKRLGIDVAGIERRALDQLRSESACGGPAFGDVSGAT